jgi:hypothetical protein
MYYANGWDLWALYHPVTFDGEAKLIYVNDGVTAIDVKIDLYSNWKEWVRLRDYAKFLPALRTIGGDPTTAGQKAGDIYFLQNGWRFVIDLSKTRLIGSLFSDDFETPLLDADTLQPVYQSLVSSLVTTPPAPDLSSLNIPSAVQNAQAVWNSLMADFIAANSFGKQVQDIPATTAALIPAAPTAATIANAVWDEASTDHLLAGSTGELLAQIKADTGSVSISNIALTSLVTTLLKYERNRTKIDTVNKQMIIYDDDCSTILHTFDLKDSTGAPSVTSICERRPPSCP